MAHPSIQLHTSHGRGRDHTYYCNPVTDAGFSCQRLYQKRCQRPVLTYPLQGRLNLLLERSFFPFFCLCLLATLRSVLFAFLPCIGMLTLSFTPLKDYSVVGVHEGPGRKVQEDAKDL